MLVKWAIGGAIVGIICAIWTDTEIASGLVFGAVVAVVFRKWVFRKLWL